MKKKGTLLAIGLLLSLGTFTFAQLFDFINPPKCKPVFTQTTLTHIMHNNGELRGDDGGPLYVLPEAAGNLTVTTATPTEVGLRPIDKVGFYVAIREFHTNTIWLYNQEVAYDIDLPSLMQHCDRGDRLIFMVADRQYRLPRFEVMIGEGC